MARDGFAAYHSWRAEVLDHLQLDDALVEYGRALELYGEMSSEGEWEFADTLFRRGDLQARADDAVLAGKDLVAAAELFEKIGDHFMHAKCISGIAELLDRQGHRITSRQYFEAAAQIALRLNNPKKAGGFLFRYGCKLAELREFDEQKKVFSALLNSDWLTSGQRLDILKMLCLAAKAAGQDGDVKEYSEALLEILDERIVHARNADERRRHILSKGHALEDLEQHDRAVACYRRGLQACEAADDRSGLIESWWCMSQVMARTKKQKEEREAYEKILTLVGDRHDIFHFPMALTMLAQLDIKEKHYEEARARLDDAERENELQPNPMVSFLIQDLRKKLPAS